jgi:hypothetical protein
MEMPYARVLVARKAGDSLESAKSQQTKDPRFVQTSVLITSKDALWHIEVFFLRDAANFCFYLLFLKLDRLTIPLNRTTCSFGSIL